MIRSIDHDQSKKIAMPQIVMITLLAVIVAGCSLPGAGNMSLSERAGSMIPSATKQTTIEAPHLVSFVGNGAWPSLRSAMITALLGSEDGERVMWKSSRPDVMGTVTPITSVTAGDGRRCRRIAVTAASRDRGADEVLSEACPVGANGWRISPL